MRKKSGLITTIIFVIILLVGLSVMLYPIVSNWWNQNMASHTISNYNDTVAVLDETKLQGMLEEAYQYNEKLSNLHDPFTNHESIGNYYDVLDISGSGIMGVINIPIIKVELPIYHGTSDSVLNIAAGHLEGSTLPVGGIGTHSVISAHRGLPSAKLFSDLDQLVVGDTFTITVLNDIYTYEIEEILIVLPHEMDKLAIYPDKDYVTLMTCTPYGVNTHRLLLRAHRIETIYQSTVRVNADAMQVDPMLVVPGMCVPLLVLLIIFWTITGRKRSSKTLPHYNEKYAIYPGRRG
ncbi:MAG: class C sortase [Ruminococcus sp.]|nr:class C sortase [Ruminococcus sp.]